MLGTKALVAAIIAGTVHAGRGVPILDAVDVAKRILRAIEDDHTFDEERSS